MKKVVLGILISLFAVTGMIAGDVATFVDKGFSEDGKYYIFGQYGRTDKKYQGWAEIYQVDIASNDYVDGGVFKTKPSASTVDKSGSEVYESLEAKSYYYLKKIPVKPANPEHVLYICDDPNKAGSDKIEFKDFRTANKDKAYTYSVQLVQTVVKSGKELKSSFYIMVEKKDSNGNIVYRTKVGNPDIQRKLISGYKIVKIMCDESEQNMIFVVEKTQEDDTGISIRYMVEAAKIE